MAPAKSVGYLLKPTRRCPHGSTFAGCGELWCVSRIADVSLQSKYVTEPEKPSEARSVPMPVPEGQSEAAYWQAARKHHVSKGVDKVIAGECAWSDLARVRVSRNRVYPMAGQPRMCAACDGPLERVKKGAKYCSPACRVRAHRGRTAAVAV